MGNIAERILKGKLKGRQVRAFKGKVCQLTRKEEERVKFNAMLEGKKVCFPGNQWLEEKILFTGAYYFYIVGTEEVNA